eukprot:TRINITY_DN18000_c0_g1_i2.p1 TRINITY_DN18000_c0_g1~~TRINITY_DN18000_c0_g1_i2.p1  ORF type:complete len:582 (-),score=123.64 TRINITY_DN18000_c0_g1_i2:31-1776(-)
MYDVLSLPGVQMDGWPQPAAGVNSISPEWHMSPTGDSSTNFLFAIRLAGANSELLSEFVKAVPKKGDWNFKRYLDFVTSHKGATIAVSGAAASAENTLLTAPSAAESLEEKTASVLKEAVEAFSGKNGGTSPSYGDVLSIVIPSGLKEKFPGSWSTIMAVLGPDCGCRSKRPYVPAFRSAECGNIEKVGDKYRYIAADEKPRKPMATQASMAVLFSAFLRMLVKARSLGLPALVTPQIGLSVFNHDATVAQNMIALAMKAYRGLDELHPPAHPLVLYLASVDESEKVLAIEAALHQSISKWDCATLDEAAAEIASFLPGLRKVPKPHVRPSQAASEEETLHPYLTDEPPAFAYTSENAVAALDSAPGSTTWQVLSKFLWSEEFLHFKPDGLGSARGKYSFWLCPAVESSLYKEAKAATDRCSEACGMESFPPHVTLCPSFLGTQQEVTALAAKVAAALAGPISAEFSGEVSVSDTLYFRALVLELRLSEDLSTATKCARKALFPEGDARLSQPFSPHLSLLYGKHSPDALGAARHQVIASCAFRGECACTFSDLVVTDTSSKEYWQWPEIIRFRLGALGKL